MSDHTSTYINPLTDFGFKYIFGREADKDFTISFLNALNIAPKPIVDLTFVDKENPGESEDDRALIYDLHCELEDKTKIIVEMQNRYQTNFDDRAIYYMAADLYTQGQRGRDWGYKLIPVYGVFVMNFEWKDAAKQHLREDVCLYNMQTESVFSDKMKMTFLKIPLMVKDAEDCRTTLERWLYILKNMEKMEAIPQTFRKDPVFRKLGEVAQYAALNDEDKRAYNKSLKAYRDAYAIYETERAEGRAQGLAEGRAEGRAEGLAEGRAAAIAEKTRLAREIGVSEDIIAKLFGSEMNN